MGTVVGITLSTTDAEAGRQAIDAAYRAIEAGEAELSEWRSDSLVHRLNTTGGPVAFPPTATTFLQFVVTLNTTSGGHFDVTWRGGPGGALEAGPDGWRLRGGPLDLGGVLKGHLNDQAAATLRAHGVEDFLIDAAGDVLAHGHAPGRRGWEVGVPRHDGQLLRVVLVDEALSTSGNSGQPGHIHDATDGHVVPGNTIVSVVAPSGLVADALATAIYAGAPPALAREYDAVAVLLTDPSGWSGSRGARRRFHPRSH